MEARPLGATGIAVPVLGLGAGALGAPTLSESDASALLHGALDLGVTLIDTARSYGLSEERIGRHLSRRRSEFLLSTKGGYGVEGVPDWTGEAVRLGINRALRTLRTDRLDIFHLHSCPRAVLEDERILSELEAAVDEGKVRVTAYSGEGDDLGWAVGSGQFSVIQTSVNLVDQRSMVQVVPLAAEKGMGVLAKRALGGSVWRYAEPPPGNDLRQYWDRWTSLRDEAGPREWGELALRFSAYAPGVSCALAGSGSIAHLQQNVVAVERGRLSDEENALVTSWFDAHDKGWDGVI